MKVLPFQNGHELGKSARLAAEHLRGGGVIGGPTETVYGFGSLLEDAPLERMARLKGGRAEKAFLVLIRSARDLPGLRWTESALQLAEHFWPGPLTLALHASDRALPARIRLGDTVAVRVSPHPGVRALLDAVGGPMTSSSANAPRQRPARSAEELIAVLDKLDADDVLVLDGGRLPDSLPSTLVECVDDRAIVRRSGAIEVQWLRSVLPHLEVDGR